jgi:hypothetical protein
MFQLHVAAFTLRFAPEALASLAGTLESALAVHAATPLAHATARTDSAFDAETDRWSKS